MNRNNLQAIIFYLENEVDPKTFTMEFTINPIETVQQQVAHPPLSGNIQRHCHVLDNRMFNKHYFHCKEHRERCGDVFNINEAYLEWTEEFIGIQAYVVEWNWIFSMGWVNEERCNTVSHAIERIQALLDGTWRSHPDYSFFIDWVINI